MFRRSWIGKNLSKIIAFIILLSVSLLFLLPLVYGVLGSVRTYNDLTGHPESLFPTSPAAFTWDGYKEHLSKKQYVESQANQ